MSKLPFYRILPGMTVVYNDLEYTVADLVNSKEVLLRGANNEFFNAEASNLSLISNREKSIAPDLASISDSQWQKAQSNYKAIEGLIELGEKRTREDVVKVAADIGKHLATIYRWVDAYENSGLISSLIRKTRADKGGTRIEPEVEKIIQNTLDDFYLTAQRRTLAKTAFEIRKRCMDVGLPPPDPSTVRARIVSLSAEHVLRKRKGAKAANERFTPLRGSFPGADYPLAVVQIDHTPVDVIAVHDDNRKSVKRPYLTLAIDVYSEMCVGFYMSLDPPGSLSTGLCISNAILHKEDFLKSLGLEDYDWPCWGVMSKIHTDNAKEFKGTLLGKATEQYGIVTELRPKGKPGYGGDIERAFRTYMEEMHNELPGTTFSNVYQKDNYDSENRAVMSMDALIKWFTLFLVGIHHQKPHSGNLGLPPIAQWKKGIVGDEINRGTGIPMRIKDENRLRLDFMPFVMRTVQEYGIRFEGIHYWTDALRAFIHIVDQKEVKSKREFVCRYDPRDLSKIWMFDEINNQYLEIPYSDFSREPASLWEVKAAKRKLKSESKAATNEELIFKTMNLSRDLVNSESIETKKSLRILSQRKKGWDTSKKISLEPINTTPILSETEIKHEDFEPFDGIRESK